MARVKFSLEIPLPFSAVETWRGLTDWVDHGRWIPLTRVWITKPAAGVGLEFVARSGVGFLAINDRMRVIEQNPEEFSAVVEKFGRPLSGTAGFKIQPIGESCILQWFEDIEIKGVPNLVNRPLTFVTKLMFQLAVGNLKHKGLIAKPGRATAASSYGQQLQSIPQYYNLHLEIRPQDELHSPTLRQLVKEVLDAASQTLVTEVVVDYQTHADSTLLQVTIKTADRQTAHDLLDVIQPIKQQAILRKVGGDLTSARSRFGTIDLSAEIKNEGN